MSDLPAAPPMAPSPAYPVTLTLDAPLEIARWRWFVQWLLAIPHFIVLGFLGMAASFAMLAAWLIALFTGTVPDGIAGFLAMQLRYQMRVTSYVACLFEDYPPFDFTMTLADPGGSPIRVDVAPVGKHSRLMVFFRYFAAIPHLIVLAFVNVALVLVLLLAFVAAVIKGSWPAGMRDFVVGVTRWQTRFTAWMSLIAVPYPPMSTT